MGGRSSVTKGYPPPVANPSSMRRLPRLVALLVAVATVVGAPAATAAIRRSTAPPPPPPPPFVLLYGDSLVEESAWYARDLLANVAKIGGIVVGAPGGATCDLLPRMRADAARYRPTAVVIAFSGNALTPCMQDERGEPLRGQAWVDRYRQHTVDAIVAFRAGSPKIWLGTTPIAFIPEKKGDPDTKMLNGMLRELAAQNPRVRIAESANAVLDNGVWARTLPCLRYEPCQGGVDARGRLVNAVRATDGAHFCPLPYEPSLSGCMTHASGGLRFAAGLLFPTLREQGVLGPERLSRTMYEGAA